MGANSNYGEIQSRLHIMLRSYVEDSLLSERGKIGGEIPYPALVVFVGDNICNEAVDCIIPEMKRHWPTSFANGKTGRLQLLLVDRTNTREIVGGNCLHYCLTSPGPLRSLADNIDDCRAVNDSILSIFNNVGTNPDARNMRIIAVTSVDDPDSLITGEVLAVSRQFGKDLIHQVVNPGELFAFLPDRASLQEQGYRQTFDFLVKWKEWADENGKLPNVYMRFGTTSTRATAATRAIPAVGRALIFDCIDNRGNPDTDHWRDRLMVDVLETARLIEDERIHIPGIVEDKLNDEYVLLRAMDPDNWKMPLEKKKEIWRTADELKEQMKKEIIGSEGNDVENCIAKWLQRACVARLSDGNVMGGFYPVKDIEDRFFGTSIRHMYSRFREEFMSRKAPDSFLEKFTTIKREDQIQKTITFLEEIIDDTRKEAPDRGEYPNTMCQMPHDVSIWDFKENTIDPCYTGLAPKCAEALIHSWAEECKEALSNVLAESQGALDQADRFAEICSNEERAERNLWSDVPYDGPTMKELDRKDINVYKAAVKRIMEYPSQESFYKLFTIVRERMESENYPSIQQRIRAICHTTDARSPQADGGRFKIENGVDEGKIITFTKVSDFAFVQFFADCIDYFGENEENRQNTADHECP